MIQEGGGASERLETRGERGRQNEVATAVKKNRCWPGERERARKGRRKRGGGRKEYKGREAKETSISLIHPRTLQPLLLLFIYFLPFGVRSFFLI